MDWVNFDEIKKTVTLQMVIDRYGWQLRRAGAHVLRGKCPLPSHSSEESRESFIATLNKGAGGAWSCHSNSCAASRGGRKGGNVLDLVAAVEGCSIREAAIKLQMWFLVTAAGQGKAASAGQLNGNRSSGKTDGAELVSKQESGAGEMAEGNEANKPLTFTLKSVDPGHPYLKERGITEETAQQFGVGFFGGKGSMSGRVVFPIQNKNGELVGYAGRAIDGTEPRYKFPVGLRKSLELWNLAAVTGMSAVLVEGFFDCMKVWQAGYVSIALMGSAMSEAQENMIAEQFAEVVVMLDGDEAGRKATEEIIERLQRRVFRVMAVNLPPDVQPDQLSEGELEVLLGAVVSFTRGRGASG